MAAPSYAHFTAYYSRTTSFRKSRSEMSIAQTFHLAHRARGKLSSEAQRTDHNLRLLVGHANLLDSLMLHLSEAEAEQEQWFNNIVRGNEAREMEEEDYGSLATDYESDSESDIEEDEEDDEIEQRHGRDYTSMSGPEVFTSLSKQTVVNVHEVDSEDDEEYEDGEDEDGDGMYTLTRTSSHRPPSLCEDVSDSEDDDATPPSPPQPSFHHPALSAKERIQTVTTSYYDSHADSSDPSYVDVDYFHTPSAPMITSY